MNIFKSTKNKYFALNNNNFSSGFVILFAVTIASILLAIALGVANIALKEVKFGISAKDTNDAFFAADTGLECALANDKLTSNSFVQSGGSGAVLCLGNSITPIGSFPNFSFVINNLGSAGNACASITVTKTVVPADGSIRTIVVSKGYNIGNALCNSTNPDRIERSISANY